MKKIMDSILVKLYLAIPNWRGRYRLGRLLDTFGPFSCKTTEGIWIKSYLSSTNDNAFCREDNENELLFSEIEKLLAGDVFIDVGANVGYYSALAAKKVGQTGLVISIEPSPREYTRLLWARDNNEHMCKWLTFNEGASNATGVLGLKVHNSHTGMNSFSNSDFVCSEIHAPVRPLDTMVSQILQSVSKSDIDLMKVDVEGWESFVLMGSQNLLELNKIKKIVLEVSPQWLERSGSSKLELYKMLSAFGYSAQYECNKWQYDELFILD